MPTSIDYAAEVDKFKLEVKERGEKLVKESFPQRILQLNEMLKEAPFNSEDPAQFCHELKQLPVPVADKDSNHAGVTTIGSGHERSFLLDSGSVPLNPHITAVIELLKPIVQRAMEEANLLKMWVTFMIPKIEDGNNFGVSIQEEMLSEISAAEAEAAAYYHEMIRYFSMHAKLVSRVIKFPHVADFRRSVSELDEKMFVSLRVTLTELRNRYATLHDAICKNLEKIKKPRNSHLAHSMY